MCHGMGNISIRIVRLKKMISGKVLRKSGVSVCDISMKDN
jgi:hypothetical protein